MGIVSGLVNANLRMSGIAGMAVLGILSAALLPAQTAAPSSSPQASSFAPASRAARLRRGINASERFARISWLLTLKPWNFET